jgi:hypothetical protein
MNQLLNLTLDNQKALYKATNKSLQNETAQREAAEV